MSINSFQAEQALQVAGRQYRMFRLGALAPALDPSRLPFSLKVLLENLLRHEDGISVKTDDIEAVARWDPAARPSRSIAFRPTRVLMQDFTGVPAVVDLAALRDALARLGGDPALINPVTRADLVIDHSVIADVAGRKDAFERNAALEFERNRERYAFLRWGQTALKGLRIVPPDTGIVHQVNLEYLASVVADLDGTLAPDTLVGTDSHTTMINGLGVLGWGVGGIEAEASMLGQPITMLIPRVVGVRLEGRLREGTTATDLVLTIAQVLRQHGVVGKFVEFTGPGLSGMSLETRATIANMSPEYGSTCAMFPIDRETLRYLRVTGRSSEQLALIEAYAREQGMFHQGDAAEPVYSENLRVDLSEIEPSLAGPRRPQDRVALADVPGAVLAAVAPQLTRPSSQVAAGSADQASAASFPASDPPAAMAAGGTSQPGKGTFDQPVRPSPAPAHTPHEPVAVRLNDGTSFELDHGHVVIAAITSCTNTSNPSVMIAAGLLARNAAQRGLRSRPWVKTSLAPGSKVVMDYYREAGLIEPLEALGFHLVGFGCTTCIGNSGALAPEISAAIASKNLAVCSVLSGNRNFEGRINPDCRLNWLASPPLVVAYAIAGTMRLDLQAEPLGFDSQGAPVYLRELWPSDAEIHQTIEQALTAGMYRDSYAKLFDGDKRWSSLPVPSGGRFAWDPSSTYVRRPELLDDIGRVPEPLRDLRDARALLVLGDTVTTDHISPAGAIRSDSAAGLYLQAHGVQPKDFNSYGARRGNHEVMVRGTFGNIRLRNQLAEGSEGPVTVHLPDGEAMSIYDASMQYRKEGTPLIVLAGLDYGSGSSRDWAAKGTRMLGVRAVIARSFERIHRSNLVGMGVLPLQFAEGESMESIGLHGRERFNIAGIEGGHELPGELTVTADGKSFRVRVRVDTPVEMEYLRHGGILPYVLRQRLE